MSQPLQSFLQDLATEIETDCENLTVVVDNAHIPIHCSEEFADDTMNASEFAINAASFPATFLRETSRWDAMQGCSNSDFLLSIPSRNRNEMDRWLIHCTKQRLDSDVYLNDSMEQFRRELPLHDVSTPDGEFQKKSEPLDRQVLFSSPGKASSNRKSLKPTMSPRSLLDFPYAKHDP